MFNQANIGTVSRATLGRMLRDGEGGGGGGGDFRAVQTEKLTDPGKVISDINFGD